MEGAVGENSTCDHHFNILSVLMWELIQYTWILFESQRFSVVPNITEFK